MHPILKRLIVLILIAVHLSLLLVIDSALSLTLSQNTPRKLHKTVSVMKPEQTLAAQKSRTEISEDRSYSKFSHH